MSNTELTPSLANAYGLAAYHLQNAVLTQLVVRGILTMREAAVTFSGAIDEMGALRPTPDAIDSVALAKVILQKSATAWDIQAKGH